MLRNDILERKSEILSWIDENKSKAFICKQFKCRPSTLENYLKKLKIVYKGNQGSKGKPAFGRKSAIEYTKGTCVNSNKLKIKLIEDGVKEFKCEQCENSIWNGKPIPLELHHVDGNRFNNELENLQILCPNCHTLTPNYGNRKRK